jgi:hypothetical protein
MTIVSAIETVITIKNILNILGLHMMVIVNAISDCSELAKKLLLIVIM